MAVELKIPQSGESISEVQIGEWRKNVGDFVERDEIVAEIETDKASMELPAPSAGRIEKINKKVGETAGVGEVIAVIDDTAKAPASSGAAASKPKARSEGGDEDHGGGTAVAAPPKPASQKRDDADSIVMPAARQALREAGLSPGDVEGTGRGGRIQKQDVERAVAARKSGGADARNGHAPEEEIVPMTMLRRTIAERLVSAQRNAALLTTFNEIDMTEVMALRKAYGEEYVKRYGVKLGFMSFFVKAAIDALKLVPEVNAEIRGTDIVYKNHFDIGVAVGTEKGLVVPIVRDADRLSFAEIEIAIADLAKRARDRKLDMADLQGGTFTISNGGVYGSMMSTPIINPPQSGILGLHAIQERPIALNGEVVIRPMMYVALSYDHRIIDGSQSVTWLKRVKHCIENPTRMLLEV